jgi:NADPH:quinone reductase-like Zn-dependent oxidoreductase
MKGFGFSEHGGPERLGWVDVPEPRPGPGEVRVRLRTAAFNHLDRFVLAGIPGVPVERPHILGSDGAGEVDAVGDGVGDLPVGSEVLLNPGIWDATCPACQSGSEELCREYRILGEHTQGTATEFVVLPRRNLHPKPGRLGWAEAAAAPLVFQTAWRAVRTVGALRPGETVAIIGAGGGTALAALQVARLAGGHVAVLSRSPEKLERARRAGADATFLIPPDGRFDRALWEWSGKNGVDVIFDSVGRATIPTSVRALARGGRIVVIGATTGSPVDVELRTLFWRQASIRGSMMSNASEFRAMLAELARGRLTPVIDREYPLAEAAEAFRRFGSDELFGKVVLRVR